MEIVLVFWLFCGAVAGLIFSSKGRDGCGGFAMGFLLGPIGVVIALVTSPDHKTLEQNQLKTGEMRKCPHCAELVRREAVKCRFCGSDLPPPPKRETTVKIKR